MPEVLCPCLCAGGHPASVFLRIPPIDRNVRNTIQAKKVSAHQSTLQPPTYTAPAVGLLPFPLADLLLKS